MRRNFLGENDREEEREKKEERKKRERKRRREKKREEMTVMIHIFSFLLPIAFE